jgi:predicted nucleic acid-binding protein
MILIDANVFMYAAGRQSPQRAPCQAYLRSLVEPETNPVCTDAEVLREFLYRYKALGVQEVGFGLVDAITRLSVPVLSIAEADVIEARRLMERFEDLSARDVVHLGVMQQHGIERILSYDRGLDRVGWAVREEP